uniref:HAT C-terminal dimerisation domain-containing protein n=1 Tax=Gasterosteus aculeatus aculeatus TaxID=481459 RepID=A0AAQ4QFC3_GASAC
MSVRQAEIRAATWVSEGGKERISCVSSAYFLSWKYGQYFSLVESKDKNVVVSCKLCAGAKTLSTSKSSNSNLMNLLKQHATTKLVAKDPSPTDAEVQPISQAELNKLIPRYVVDDMHPLSTVESVAFRQLISKISVINGGSGQMCRNTFSSYLDREYAKMQVELKKTFEGLQHVSTTSDIWTAYNKSFLGVTAHWINPNKMLRGKSALACQRFKGRHTTYDIIATEIDNIHNEALVPCTTRWNLFYDAVARISEIPVAELNTISSQLQMKCINEREHQVLKEYCVVMKPLTVAFDILQSEDNCFYGTLLPTLETLILVLILLLCLLCHVFQAIKTRFARVLEDNDALLHPGETPTTQRRPSTKEDEFFSFDESEEDAYVSVEDEAVDYFKSGATGMDALNQFPIIKKVSLKYNAATPSSAHVERLFSFGNLILSP